MAIDPGSTYSGWVTIDALKNISSFGKDENSKVRDIASRHYGPLAIEYPQPRGQTMYRQLVDTIFWIGRFVEAYGLATWFPIDRKDVKMHLCGRVLKITDANVRAAIISQFPATGRGRHPEIGVKASPGPLFGVHSDIFQAIAVALTFFEKHTISDLDLFG